MHKFEFNIKNQLYKYYWIISFKLDSMLIECNNLYYHLVNVCFVYKRLSIWVANLYMKFKLLFSWKIRHENFKHFRENNQRFSHELARLKHFCYCWCYKLLIITIFSIIGKMIAENIAFKYESEKKDNIYTYTTYRFECRTFVLGTSYTLYTYPE